LIYKVCIFSSLLYQIFLGMETNIEFDLNSLNEVKPNKADEYLFNLDLDLNKSLPENEKMTLEEKLKMALMNALTNEQELAATSKFNDKGYVPTRIRKIRMSLTQ
jgi:hypothetical protein